ncbi:hypothetical protein [Acinetobacter sp. SFA]|uniref:hypothetical protein n=1 Tax=Acinetobacter sp. SFA TaxID=1805633 RepID=UPI0007D08DFA|nr:hypothetical protein [Acinetobacter sp. SFA]OAL83036.1 hypothetical protein AY607_01310 [Acinetobacter sp. SFA]
MKVNLLPVLLLSFSGCACQGSQPEDKVKPIITSIEQSENTLAGFINQLESDIISVEKKKIILCEDYPREFETNFLSNMLKLESSEYTKESLLKDLNLNLSYYKHLKNIQC